MFSRLLTAGLVAAVCLSAMVPAHGQEPGWGIRVHGEGGWAFPVRNLGKNSVDLAQLSAMQVVAKINDSPTVGGGVEVLLPDRSLRIRGTVRSTVGATARGILGICESGKIAKPGEGLCAIVETSDARIVDGDVQLMFLGGRPDAWLRPLLWIGLGARSYDFSSDVSECDRYTGEPYEVCRRSRDIFEDPSVNPLLIFGAGLETNTHPCSAFVRVSAVSSFYSGGAGIADGGRQLDLVLNGGVAVRVR